MAERRRLERQVRAKRSSASRIGGSRRRRTNRARRSRDRSSAGPVITPARRQAARNWPSRPSTSARSCRTSRADASSASQRAPAPTAPAPRRARRRFRVSARPTHSAKIANAVASDRSLRAAAAMQRERGQARRGCAPPRRAAIAAPAPATILANGCGSRNARCASSSAYGSGDVDDPCGILKA